LLKMMLFLQRNAFGKRLLVISAEHHIVVDGEGQDQAVTLAIFGNVRHTPFEDLARRACDDRFVKQADRARFERAASPVRA
jgi:hypothetical protein